ncbi:hypothetical protein FRC02_000328 [Tulasnella sp. 418]|nr:hypothetical protein FRC02_000328 [Tulasnella sp. 418]
MIIIKLIFLSDVVRRPRWTVNDQGSPTSEHRSWLFIEEPGDEPPLYRRNSHIGPIPSGVYWLGQAEIRTTSVPNAAKLLSTGALTVTSQALQEQSATPLHLSPLQDRPWPHQVWMIESGMRGYSLKNLVTNTYLTLVDREVVTETLSPDSVPFEWSIREFSRRRPDDIQSYTLSPSTDLSCFLTINFDSAFNKVSDLFPHMLVIARLPKIRLKRPDHHGLSVAGECTRSGDFTQLIPSY